MCDMEEVSSESSRKMQDTKETTLEASWVAVTGKKEKDGWRLEPEGEAETPDVKVLWNEAEGVPANLDGESHHERAQAKSTRREREAPGEEGEEINNSPKSKVIRMETEEPQDCVRESSNLGRDEAQEISFVLCAISTPQKPMFWCDNR